MQKKMLLTLSVVGSVLCNQEAVKTAFAQESGPSALLERASTKTATTTGNLNLRDKASTGGKILTTIPKGKTVTILSEKDANGWYKVSYGGKTGYVSGGATQQQIESQERHKQKEKKPAVENQRSCGVVVQQLYNA